MKMKKMVAQTNYEQALRVAWDRLAGRHVEQLQELGISEPRTGSGHWFIPVLNTEFEIDARGHYMGAIGYGEVGPTWQILALHALLAEVPLPRPTRQIAFEEIPDARGYSGPYRGRVVTTFSATVGRTRESFRTSSEACGGQVVPGGDLAVRLPVFPHVPLTIVWYAGDDELSPGASFLYDDNIASVLEVEDIVVMTEQVVRRMRGQPW